MAIIEFPRPVRAVLRDTNNLFIYPTAPGPATNFVANELWELGSTVNIQWTTSATAYHIELYQQRLDVARAGTKGTILTTDGSDASGEQHLSWDVSTLGSSLDLSPVYFLWLFPKNDNADSFTSHYFNITTSKVSSSGSSTTSISQINISEASLTSSASTSSLLSGFSSTPSIASSQYQGPDSDPTALKVGLGVGLGIGIPLLLVAGIWLGLWGIRQRRSKSQNVAVGPSVVVHHDAKQSYAYGTVEQELAQDQVYEADSIALPVELDSTQLVNR